MRTRSLVPLILCSIVLLFGVLILVAAILRVGVSPTMQTGFVVVVILCGLVALYYVALLVAAIAHRVWLLVCWLWRLACSLPRISRHLAYRVRAGTLRIGGVMMRHRTVWPWVLAAVVFLFGMALHGGVYRVVGTNTGGVYKVNKFTGKTWYFYNGRAYRVRLSAGTPPTGGGRVYYGPSAPWGRGRY